VRVWRPWPWPWIRSHGIPPRSTHRPLHRHQTSFEWDNR